MLPFEFDEAEPPANQFHATILFPLPFPSESEPIPKPSLSNDVTPETVCSAVVALD